MKSIDLNCDMGEIPEAVADGSQEALMQYVSSVNVACGGHAGGAATMRETMQQALRHGVSVGAHPGYEDRADFGRKELQLAAEEIAEMVHRQVLALAEIAEQCGARISHVKVHGALYNQAARNREIARCIAEGVRRWNTETILVGLAGSVMLEEFRSAGFSVAAEAFADRRYEPDGSLRSRKFTDALLRDPVEAAEQASSIVNQGSVLASDGSVVPVVAQTICIHGDTPGAIEIAAAVNRRLQQAAIHIAGLHSKS
ncbi:MAG: 5-oxoprolinase subunit PxpA [Candidatus Acidiferrum sp.]